MARERGGDGPEPGTVTLLFTDLVGSTELFARLGDDAAEQVRRLHFRLLRQEVTVRGGQEVKSLGDGLMVVFPSAVEAVSAAVAIQRAVESHNRAGVGPPFQVRIGLHAGEPVRDEDDYFGMAVIVAKRLCDRAAGDQILASGIVTGLVGSRGSFRVRPLGLLDLKGVGDAVAASEVVWRPEPHPPVADARLRVLGPIEVVDETGTAVPLASARQRLLLAVLAASSGNVVSADQLVETLWGDDQPADPRGSLQSQVWRLRKLLGAALETTPTGYRLQVGSDADRFERLVAAARQAEADPDTALARWNEALSCWRGPAFAEVAGHPALVARAAALDTLRAEAGEARARALLAAGRATEAVAAAVTLADEAPYREGPVELRMRGLAALGRSVEALRAYETFRRRLAEDVGVEPSPELRALESEILRHDRAAAPAAAAVPAAAPPPEPPSRRAGTVVRPPTMAAPIDSFVGREAELALTAELLTSNRLVTVTGPGGVGKTRLSLQAVDSLAPRYPDGVWCCDLTSATADDRVADVVASTLRLDQRAGTTTVERIVEFLASKRGLLLLDNCEHVLDGGAALARAVLSGGAVDILATSREPLGIPGEQRLPLDPLPVPEAVDPQAAAVSLFARRAAAANPRFELTDDNVAAVCELCRRVDGLPLVIELAAARVAARSVGEVNAEIAEHLGEVGGGGRGRVARHRSTHALVEWSYELLADDDRRFFEQLSVFAGGWAAEAAGGVWADDGPGGALDRLVRLVDQSLVVARPQGDATRYTFLEPVRAYAAGRLRDAGRHHEARDRHAGYFVDLAEQADHGLRGPDEAAWVGMLDRELANLRAAHQWLLETGDGDGALRLTSSLFWYGYGGAAAECFTWAEQAVERFADDLDHPRLPTVYALGAVGAWRRGDLARSRRLAERGVEAAGDDAVAGRLARAALGDVCGFAGDFDAAVLHFLAAVDLSRAVGDDFHAAWDTGSAALVLAYAGRSDQACARADEVMAAALEGGSPSMLAFAHYVAGEVRMETSLEEALPLLEIALAEARRVPNRFVLGVAGLSTVSGQARTADPRSALARYPDLIEHWSRTGAWNQQWATVRTLIETLARAGHGEPAAVLHGALCASPTATPLVGGDATRMEAVVTRLAGELGKHDLAEAQARGATLGDAGAVSYATQTLRLLVPDPG